MGLDMYLLRANREELDGWENLNSEERSYVSKPFQEVYYWRKANQIRQWIVENCDYPEYGNCEEIEITKEKLQALVNACNKVLNNHELADKIMPTSDGFFFGDTEYDERYFDDLASTAEGCAKIIESTDWDKEIIIYTDWW